MQFLGVWIVLLACLCASIEGFRQEMLAEILPGYAVTTAIDRLNSTKCRKEMQEFRDAVDRRVLWSMKMLDASGQPSHGFISGNNYWSGHRQECEILNQKLVLQVSVNTNMTNPIYRNAREQFAPFELYFFSAHFRHNSSMQYHFGAIKQDTIVLGLCLPASCSEHEVGTMLKKVFDDRVLAIGEIYSMDFELTKVSNLQDDYLWLLDGRIVIAIIILVALLGIVIAGTLYDYLVPQAQLRKKRGLVVYESNNTCELKDNVEGRQEHVQEDAVHSELEASSRIGRVLMYFSFYSNIQQIFNINNSSSEIAVFHGIKVFSAIWIIIGHEFFYNQNILVNKIELYALSTLPVYQLLTSVVLSVETFFFASGYLLTYVFLINNKKGTKAVSFRTNAINFVGTVVKRYIRLTPAYAVTILLVIAFFSPQGNVSLWYFPDWGHDTCLKHWWRNVLYINNFFEWNELCANWTWYLASDMQFYIFGLFLLLLSNYYYNTALAIGAAATLVSVALNGYITYATGYIPTFDTFYATLTHMYIRPWMRIQPYLMGMGTALFVKKFEGRLHLSKKVLAVCWILAILCNCTILFGLMNRNMSLGLSVCYQMFHRLGWSLGIAWLVVACATNNAGIINRFLTLPCWIPLSKVTLCVYLLNPIIVVTVSMSSNYPLFIEPVPGFVLGFGIIVICYICGFVLSAITEVPSVLLLRKLNTLGRTKK